MKIRLNNEKEITIREWLGKDRKNFKKMLKLKGDAFSELDIVDTLMYPCITENVSLTIEESRYVIAKIREISISEKIKFSWKCPKCDIENKETITVDQIFKAKVGNFGTCVANNKTFKFSEVKNHQFYIEKMRDPEQEDKELIDLFLHIDTIDNNNDFSIDSLMEMFDEMPTRELDIIFEEYKKQLFSIDDVSEFTCKCKHKEKFVFDEIPDFLPESWFN